MKYFIMIGAILLSMTALGQATSILLMDAGIATVSTPVVTCNGTGLDFTVACNSQYIGTL